MARNPRPLRGASILSKSVYNRISPRSSYPKDSNPFGPQMACDIFGVYDYDDAEEVCEASSDHYEQEDLPMEEVWYQAELPLENVREMEERHLREIKKFERAYRKMCHNALKWHYLMEDLKDNEQLKKMFNDIQLMRKLGGSEGV